MIKRKLYIPFMVLLTTLLVISPLSALALSIIPYQPSPGGSLGVAPSYWYSAENNTDILPIDLVYTGTTLGVVDGVKNGNLSSSGHIMRSDQVTSDGFAFYQPSAISNLATQLNGNPTYVVANVEKTVLKKTVGGGMAETWVWSRDLGRATGATVDYDASAGQKDEAGLPKGRVTFHSTKFPDAKFTNNNGSTPTTAKVNVPITIHVFGEEFDPYESKIEWKLKIKGVEKDSASGASNSSLRSIPHTFTANGTYELELAVTDRIQRTTIVKHTIVVGDEEPPPPPPGSGGTCSLEIDISASGDMTESNMTADPSGLITESDESSEFDVLNYGIPSSEYLKVNGESEKYLTDYSYDNMTGSVTYTINVKKEYHLKWKVRHSYDCSSRDSNGNIIPNTCYYDVDHEELVDKDIDFKDPYTVGYWQIAYLNVLSFIDAVFRNYALPDEEVIVPNPDQVTAESEHSAVIEDHVFLKGCDNVDLGTEVIDGGYSKPDVPEESGLFREKAELTSRPPDVKNDMVEVDGFLSMDNELVLGIPGITHVEGPEPLEIPLAEKVEVKESSLWIDSLKVNKWETPSTITANYTSIHTVNVEPSTIEFTGYSPDKINTVTVHTPVVMYAKASDDKEHDQRTVPPQRSTPADPDSDRHAFIVDRPFTVTLPTNGQHLDVGMAPGYGDRDYEKYFREKEVKFPFDVYTETKQAFYPKETWIKVPINMETAAFFLPVWVPEDEYTVKFRSVAINAPDVLPEEHHANLNLEYRVPDEVMANHVAYDTIEVDVVGRLYDFRVTDILDFNWGNVFRTTDGLIEHTGNYYWVGDKLIDGDPRGNQAPFTLPVRHGSHPTGYPFERKNMAVKTGYQFKFDLKSKGNMFNGNDAVRITPTFYFVNKNGTDRRPVDVYYHSDSNYFVKIGSDKDKVYRSITLNEPLRNVENKQLVDTAEYTYRHPDEYGYRPMVDTLSKTSFIRNFDRDYTKQKTTTGPYGWQILNNKLRTLTGPDSVLVPHNAMVPTIDAKAAQQQWYGEYSLPADIYVVEPGRDIAGYGVQHRLSKKSPIFLQDGYIIVNFNIETIDNGDADHPRLQYHKGPLNNQWKMEGFNYNFQDSYGYNFNTLDGDVIFYHGDQSSFDDFNSSVTH